MKILPFLENRYMMQLLICSMGAGETSQVENTTTKIKHKCSPKYFKVTLKFSFCYQTARRESGECNS